MRSLVSTSLRRLVLAMLVVGVVCGVVLAQVVPPLASSAATSVASGARDLASRLPAAGASPAQAALAPPQPVQVQLQQVTWADVVERVDDFFAAELDRAVAASEVVGERGVLRVDVVLGAAELRVRLAVGAGLRGLELCAAEVGVTLAWQGNGVDEIGVVAQTSGELAPALSVGDVVVRVDPRYFRPAEVETLLGDASRARDKLGWSPTIALEEGIGRTIAYFRTVVAV